MVWILTTLFILENTLLAIRYREKILNVLKKAETRLKSKSKGSVHFLDRQDAWYSKSPLLVLHGAGYNGCKYNNSKEGIDHGISAGYKVIEIDVGITSDSFFVLTHRFEPDGEIVFCKRPSLKEFLEEGALEGETALSLEQFVNLYRDNSTVSFLIDCAHGIEYEVAKYLATLCDDTFLDKIVFQVHTLKMLKQISSIERYKNLHYNGTSKEILEILPLLKKYNVHTCSIADKEICYDNNDIIQIINSGMHVFSYVVNHNRRLQYDLDMGIRGFFTDAINPCSIEHKR